MKIYFDCSDSELLTEEEARERVEERVTYEEIYLEMLRGYSFAEIWLMLDEDERTKIMDTVIDDCLQEEFICREF